jgi:DNA-binding SARP family transcriptional activator
MSQRARASAAAGRPAQPGGIRVGGILRTRLVPPRLPQWCIARPELVDRVRLGLDGRLVTVVAGPGYGKSTLLAQALHDLGRPSVWLSCDERVRTSRALLGHLAAGLAERFPGVGARLSLEGTTEEQVAELTNEVLDTVSDDFVLAMDDIHALRGSPGELAISLLIRDLPSTVHLALTSRTALPFALTPFHAAGALELDERALALTEGETARLLEAAGLTVGADVVRELHQRTEGWLVGLLLAAQSGPFELDPHRLGPGDRHVDYLAEVVLGRQPRELKSFLEDTSVLERFTPDLAAIVSGRSDARRFIAQLLASHLFTVSLGGDGDWYRYHHLLRAHLQRRLADSGEARLVELHRRAGRGWLVAGDPSEAVRHFLAAGEPGLAVEALEPVAEEMVTTPEADALAEWLERIPAELWSSRPSLVLAHAWLLIGRREHEAAVRALEQAIDDLLDAGEQDRAAIACFRLLSVLTVAGSSPHTRGVAAGRRFLPRIDPGAEMLPLARIMLATSYAYASQYDQAEEELDVALALPSANGFPALTVYAAVNRAFFIDHYQGRSVKALAALDGAIAWLEAHQAEDRFAYIGWAHGYRAVLLGHLGRWVETLRAADQWQEATHRSGQGLIARTASWVRFGALAGLARWDELASELELAAPVAARLPGSLFAFRCHVGAAQLAAGRGDGRAVAHAIESVTVGAHPRFFRATVLTDLASAACKVGLVERARDLIDGAAAAARDARARLAQARAAMIGAAAWGSGERGDRLLTEALELSPGYEELWASCERPFAARLLTRALAEGLGPPGTAAHLAAVCGAEVFTECVAGVASAPAGVRRQLQEVVGGAVGVDQAVVDRVSGGSHSPQQRRDGGRGGRRSPPRPPIRFIALGGFGVLRGGMKIPLTAFRRERGRSLLAALLCAGGPVHREVLLEWFWPSLSPERGMRAFHVTLYELRRVLEPELERGAASSVIMAEGEAYRLSLGAGDSYDAAEFMHLARPRSGQEGAAARLARLHSAERIHAGPLFPEWPYEGWADGRRAEVERTHRKVLEDLAEALRAVGQPKAAAARYEVLLALDPEREAWHRGLMRAYVQDGERALALRQYHACRRVLRSRLGVEASAETRALYQELLTGPM